MPSVRITVVSNAQQNTRSTNVLSITAATASEVILDVARRKLRLKKPNRIFLPGGTEHSDSASLSRHLENGSVVLVSSGENYVGAAGSSDLVSSVAPVHVVSGSTFIDEAAIKQLKTTGSLPGMVYAAGMPDLHPGNRFPIGASFLTQDIVYPPLIGGDIGCGMALYATPLALTVDPSRVAEKLRGIEGPWTEGDPVEFLSGRNIAPTAFDKRSLGTLGGGNHFAELQALETVSDPEACSSLGLSPDRLHLLVHTGSRGYGQAVLHRQPLSIKTNTPEYTEYMRQHDHACAWAGANRQLVARRVFSRLCPSTELDEIRPLFEITHNNVTPHMLSVEEAAAIGLPEGASTEVLVHRKGAAPSLGQGEPLVIPGSRGARTYILVSTGSQATNGFSVAHGAGRAVDRSTGAARKPHAPDRLARELKNAQDNGMGGHVICEDDDLVFEEAPSCYKDVDSVVEDLVQAGVVRVIGIMRPVLTYKVRKE